MTKNKHLAVNITEQTFLDLCTWLSPSISASRQQQDRLRQEDSYLSLIALANQFWLVGPLTHQLKQTPYWAELPHELTSYLIELEQAYFLRSQAIQQEAIYVCQLLQDNSIDVLMIKGIASLFNGVYQPISCRFMSDIDLLIQPHDMPLAENILDSAGFKSDADKFNVHGKDHHHAPALIRENGVCYIELHRRALKHKTNPVLTTESLWQHNQVLMIDHGLNVKQASPTHQIIHSIVHSEISDSGFEDKHIDLRQLYNIVAIASYYSQAINWQTIKQHFEQAHQLNALNASLYNAFRLFGLNTPITEINNPDLATHFSACITIYHRSQGLDTRINRIKRIIKGYQSETILFIYGSEEGYPILKGRVKHFIRHLKITANHFFNRLKND